MCGILGLINTDGTEFSATDRTILDRLLGTLSNRGPDGSGVCIRRNVGFAHHRLAVRDVDGGKQPWLSPDGTCVMVYNGELYNDAELRRELSKEFKFRTNCDTETLMASYLKWGRHCVNRLRGMFALGVFDFRDNSLWLVRDRFGIKPLHFALVDNQLIFASSIGTIVEHPKFQKQPNWDVISHYLSTTRTTLGNETLFQGLLQLQPSEELTWDRRGLETNRYWEYPAQRTEVSYEESVEILSQSLTESIGARLQSDVPVGLFLSGGVDSCTIAALLRQMDSTSRYAVCATTPDIERTEGGELNHASMCAESVGVDLEPAFVDADRYLRSWQSLIQDFRTPLSTPSDVLIYEMSRLAKQNVGVVLGGEGADELLCGYEIAHWSGHDYDAMQSATGQVPGLSESLMKQYGRTDFLNESDHYFALNSLVPTAKKSAVLNPDVVEVINDDLAMRDFYQSLFDRYSYLPTAEQNLLVLHRINLESLLYRLDAATMHAGLEARVPFTDHKLVEAIMPLPFHHKIKAACNPPNDFRRYASAELASQGWLRSKRILRTLAGRHLPARLAMRRKASFPTSVQTWFSTDWQVIVSRYLSRSPFAELILASSFLFELMQAPGKAGMWLWPIMNLAMWGDTEFYAVERLELEDALRSPVAI